MSASAAAASRSQSTLAPAADHQQVVENQDVEMTPAASAVASAVPATVVEIAKTTTTPSVPVLAAAVLETKKMDVAKIYAGMQDPVGFRLSLRKARRALKYVKSAPIPEPVELTQQLLVTDPLMDHANNRMWFSYEDRKGMLPLLDNKQKPSERKKKLLERASYLERKANALKVTVFIVAPTAEVKYQGGAFYRYAAHVQNRRLDGSFDLDKLRSVAFTKFTKFPSMVMVPDSWKSGRIFAHLRQAHDPNVSWRSATKPCHVPAFLLVKQENDQMFGVVAAEGLGPVEARSVLTFSSSQHKQLANPNVLGAFLLAYVFTGTKLFGLDTLKSCVTITPPGTRVVTANHKRARADVSDDAGNDVTAVSDAKRAKAGASSSSASESKTT